MSEQIMVRIIIDLYDDGVIADSLTQHKDVNKAVLGTLALGMLEQVKGHFLSEPRPIVDFEKAALKVAIQSEDAK